jgi:hypothetical protein
VVILLEQLIGKGRDLRIHDPHIQLDKIYGSNQRYLLETIPHIGRLMEPSLDELLGWASRIAASAAAVGRNAGQDCGQPVAGAGSVRPAFGGKAGLAFRGPLTR